MKTYKSMNLEEALQWYEIRAKNIANMGDNILCNFSMADLVEDKGQRASNAMHDAVKPCPPNHPARQSIKRPLTLTFNAGRDLLLRIIKDFNARSYKQQVSLVPDDLPENYRLPLTGKNKTALLWCKPFAPVGI